MVFTAFLVVVVPVVVVVLLPLVVPFVAVLFVTTLFQILRVGSAVVLVVVAAVVVLAVVVVCCAIVLVSFDISAAEFSLSTDGIDKTNTMVERDKHNNTDAITMLIFLFKTIPSFSIITLTAQRLPRSQLFFQKRNLFLILFPYHTNILSVLFVNLG